MRYIILVSALIIFNIGCKKDKFTTVPQLMYKSIEPSTYKAGTTTTSGTLPKIIFEVTDSEGDLGFVPLQDTAFIYIKNLKTNLSDSVTFPNTLPIVFKDFLATVEVTLEKSIFLRGPNTSVKDTLFYEVYVKDFAKNKSNVIKAGPLYYIP